tara:strand:+ start:480 stop:1043 length:564 start_codon:yes stop_codon:yes gene_type:complete
MLKINIIRGAKDQEPVTKQIFFQEARKTLNGDLMIFDHDLIDIVVSKEKSRVSTFPKDSVSEETYYTQDELLTKLSKVGIIDRGSIKSGSVHSSLEGQIMESASEDISSFQLTLLEIFNFLKEDEPNMKSRELYKDTLQNFFLDPEEVDSTELGEVPHTNKKGSLDHQVRPYGYQYMYSILREIMER